MFIQSSITSSHLLQAVPTEDLDESDDFPIGAIIGIAIAAAVLLIILLVLLICCIAFCVRSRKNKRDKQYENYYRDFMRPYTTPYNCKRVIHVAITIQSIHLPLYCSDNRILGQVNHHTCLVEGSKRCMLNIVPKRRSTPVIM